MIAADILLDGFFAAVAAVGFGAVSDPPMRAFPRIALLAAVGVSVAYSLLICFIPEVGWVSDAYPWAYQDIVEMVQFWT